jgi:L-ascorbate metabolism protein UlaG (beta-lactamase superfamily)
MNKGGTVEVAGIKFTMTNALHSGGLVGDGTITYLGEPAGYVIEAENGTKLYFAGDTAVFSDMQLIGRIYQPDVAILPIGDHFTMGPREAAVALELLGVRRCVPAHYGTFPLLTGTPDALQQLAPDVEVLAPEPGETIALAKLVAV